MGPVYGALIGLGCFALGHLIGVLIWGAQLEMRVRQVEKATEAIPRMLLDMNTLTNDVAHIKGTVDEVKTLIEQRTFATTRRTRAKLKAG